MKKSYELQYHMLEQNHWWFKVRRDMIGKLVEQCKVEKNAMILDIGCSGGVGIKSLHNKGYRNLFGVDKSQKAIRLCKKNRLKNVVVMDGEKPALGRGKFDLIIASDILEHIKNDVIALKEWSRILKPGGKLIIFVPAFKMLWSKHDERNKHFRRYTKKRLVRILKETNYLIEKCSYSSFITFIPALLIRWCQRLLIKTTKGQKVYNQLTELPFLINKILVSVLKIENGLTGYINFPVGVSVFAIGIKRRYKINGKE